MPEVLSLLIMAHRKGVNRNKNSHICIYIYMKWTEMAGCKSNNVNATLLQRRKSPLVLGVITSDSHGSMMSALF